MDDYYSYYIVVMITLLQLISVISLARASLGKQILGGPWSGEVDFEVKTIRELEAQARVRVRRGARWGAVR